MAERPGIMFYFDILNDLSDFSTEEVGQLFLAVMEYGRTGEVAEFEDRGMRSIYRALMRYADRDQGKFDDKILQRRYAGWKSAQSRKGAKEEDLPSFEEWKAMISATEEHDSTRKQTTVEPRPSSYNEINQQSTINDQQSSINNQLSTLSDSAVSGTKGESRGGQDVRSFCEQQLAGNLPPEIRELYSQWSEAVRCGDMKRGLDLDAALSRAGYVADPRTGQLSKRNSAQKVSCS